MEQNADTGGETAGGGAAARQWTDVTGLCRAVAASLSDAQPLARVGDFNFFDAMSATELMDGRMDACAGVTGALHMDDILRDAMPAEGQLTPALALATMERLLACERAYCDGASMIETFKLCVFMWPQVWAQLDTRYGELGRLMLAFVKSVAKNTAVFHKLVLGADIYEEEDFHPASRAVEADMGDADAVLAAALAGMSLGAEAGKEAGAGAGAAGRSEEDSEAYARIGALLALRTQVLGFSESAHLAVAQALEISQHRAPADEEEAAGYQKILATKNLNILSACVKVHASCQGLAAEVRAARVVYGAGSGSPLPAALDLMSPTLAADTAGLFQPKIAKLVSNNPSRTIVCLSVAECLGALEDMCVESAGIAVTVPGFCAPETPFDALLAWCCAASKARFHLASRSLQWGLVHSLCAMGGIEALLLASMKASWLPEGFTSFPLCGEWISTFGKVAWESLKVMCMFRYRCLVKLDANIMSWNKVSEDAPRVDQATLPHLYPAGLAVPAQTEIYWATKWVMRIMSVLMENHLLLLAELDLLSTFELDSFYWFLEYVTSTRIWSIRKLREMRFYYDKAIHEFQIAEATQLMKDEKKNKNKKGAVKISGKQVKDARKVIETPQPGPVRAPADEVLSLAANHVYKGVDRLLLSLSASGLIRAAPACSEGASAETRFNCRYALYRSLSHLQAVSLRDFERAVASIDAAEPAVPQKLASASAYFTNAQRELNQMRKTILADVPKLNVATKKVIADFSVFTYTVETDASEKCTGLAKVNTEGKSDV
jgi:hypothetical protein